MHLLCLNKCHSGEKGKEQARGMWGVAQSLIATLVCQKSGVAFLQLFSCCLPGGKVPLLKKSSVARMFSNYPMFQVGNAACPLTYIELFGGILEREWFWKWSTEVRGWWRRRERIYVLRNTVKMSWKLAGQECYWLEMGRPGGKVGGITGFPPRFCFSPRTPMFWMEKLKHLWKTEKKNPTEFSLLEWMKCF